MLEKTGMIKTALKYLKNKKGQGLVGFGVIVAFSLVIGIAARDAGLLNALGDTYSNSALTSFAPSDIVPGETNVSGNLSAVTGGGGGTNSSGGGSGSGSGNSGSDSGNENSGSDNGGSGSGSGNSGSGSGNENSGSDNGGSGSGSGNSGGSGTEGGNSGGGNSTPGMPAGGQTGGGSGNSYSVVIGTVAATEHLKLQSEVIGTTQFNAINVSTWNQATSQEKLNTMKEGTLFYYNGEYYLMTTNDNQVQSISVNDIINWSWAKKVTKRVVDETQLVDQWGGKYYPYLYSGDIVLYGGSAYLVKNEGNWHKFPLNISDTGNYTRIN